jgi:osmotically-inducible protein OsmY
MKTKQMISWLVALSIFATFTIASSPAPSSATTRSKSDSQIKIFVEYHLMKAGLLTDNNIHVTASDGKVTLTGTVSTLYDVSLARKIAQADDENYVVVNGLSLSSPNIPGHLIEKEVIHGIQTHAIYTVFDWVTVHARKGVVTLDGWVNDPWQIGQYKDQAERVIGVREVVNHLRMAFGSDRLKYRAVRLIYDDPFYWPCRLEMNPPIHVIVNGPNLILEGRVHAIVERAYLTNLMVFRTNAPNVVDDIQLVDK